MTSTEPQAKKSRKILSSPNDDDITEDLIESDSSVVVLSTQVKMKPATPMQVKDAVAAIEQKVADKKPKPAAKKRKKADPADLNKTSAPSVNDWPGISEVSRIAEIHSVTCVDPGTANLAVIRVEFYPTLRITHARVLNLERVAEEIETKTPQFRLRSNRGATAMEQDGDYSQQAKYSALSYYVCHEAQPGSGGIFDSDFLLVEEQSFDRVMSRVESIIKSVYETVRGRTVIVLPEVDGGRIGQAQVITAKSVKSYFRPLFPLISAEADERSRRKARSKPHGMGDSHGGESEAQRREHKKNAIKYGRMLVQPSKLLQLIPRENLTEYDMSRLKEAKLDDIYDTMFMAMYFSASTMFQVYKIKNRCTSYALPAYETLPPRPNSGWEELTELAAFLGTGDYELQTLYDQLYGKDAPRI